MTEIAPIVYERVLDGSGKLVGWKVPDSELADWERRKARLFGPSSETERAKEPPAARPLEQLVTELALAIDLERRLENQFRELYSRSPVKATKLAARVTAEARAGRLEFPEGFLAWRLKELTGQH